MSFSRRADDTTTIRKGLTNDNDPIRPKSEVKHSSEGIFFDTRKETSESLQQKHGEATRTKGRRKRVDNKDAKWITKSSLSEITRTNDLVRPSGIKGKEGNGIHGVLRVSESARTDASSRKGPAIVQAGVYTKDTVNSDTIVNEISACETNLSNLVSRWSGDSVKFQHIITMW